MVEFIFQCNLHVQNRLVVSVRKLHPATNIFESEYNWMDAFQCCVPHNHFPYQYIGKSELAAANSEFGITDTILTHFVTLVLFVCVYEGHYSE